MKKLGKVVIVMGSPSDKGKMEPAIWKLIDLVDLEIHILSAHRTPNELTHVVRESEADIFIAGAGMSAALPGAIAALTVKPVIGIPLSGSALNGVDALFAIAQMPKGAPVATVAIDGAENAAILALEILGIRYEGAEDEVYKLREEMRVDVIKKDRMFAEDITREYEERQKTNQK